MTYSDISLSDPDSEPEVPRPLDPLHIMIREMLYEVRENESTISALETWVQTVDPEAYRKDPWPQDLVDAHAQYKALVAGIDPKRGAYNNSVHNSLQEKLRYTPKAQLERLRIAYEWGQAALRARNAVIAAGEEYRSYWKAMPKEELPFKEE
ncbi:hypothetical protein BO79DRAFT_213410 [Aspergillus costaricaensis CBS 115574]|uniref:Uncharacterized protein n=1 Tax=Aspergillus costaricaensis CBS 115574 TaxID=1448317 RepID=A0ACD1IT51_9EURO|nr:hypothetical protein BO79DRAFT_213410 [Aspergillus costaricaensis CBS 115574]RAK93819.1 hypothetical protein BO79DRAFT_213410 [Aspergillus costaricaensis CBS 115574]